MLARFVLLFTLTAVALTAQEQKQVPACCELESAKLSQAEIKALMKQTERIEAPCCAAMLRISGIIVLAISVDPDGNVACVQMVSGPPLVISEAIESVRKWKFRSYAVGGTKKSFCGLIALRCRGNEHGIKYKILTTQG